MQPMSTRFYQVIFKDLKVLRITCPGSISRLKTDMTDPICVHCEISRGVRKSEIIGVGSVPATLINLFRIDRSQVLAATPIDK